ncbi:MAG: D-alanyl-D-alanine carboxypeptidase family protein [Phenylobacterium sp.]
MKPLRPRRFPWAGVLLALALAACGDRGKDDFILRAPPRTAEPAPGPQPPAAQSAGQIGDAACRQGDMPQAARINAASLRTLAWTPFGRPEVGWETYARLISREIGSPCSPDTAGFAQAMAGWQAAHGLPRTGLVDAAAFDAMKAQWHGRRPVLKVMRSQGCPAPPPPEALATARPEESYGGKTIELRKGALAAYRRMVQAAKAEEPRIAEDARNLTVFSGYRSPEYDDARCARDQNCNGVSRARCSPHRTGLALDLYVGQAPGYGPDSSADPNRLYMSRTATYAWMVANAQRFGFVNYPFEPWHWEWVGEAP